MSDKEDNSKKQELVKLPSVAMELTSVKTVDKKDFEEYLGLNLDKYSNFQISPDTAKRYKQHIKSLRHGVHASVPIMCLGGKKCPIGHTCPLTVRDDEGKPDYEASNYPLFSPCPVEQDMIKLHILDLCDEYGITPEDITDLSIVSKLASLNILEYRVNASLAKDTEGVIITEVTAVDPKEGTMFLTKKAHPSLEMLERIHKIRQELLKSMIGTRREKVKAAAITGESKAKTNLTTTINSVLEKLRSADTDIIDVEFEHPIPVAKEED